MEQSENPTSQLAEVEAELRTSRSRLFFGAHLEAAYESAGREEFARHSVRCGVAGLVLYSLFLVSESAIIPDVFGLALALHVLLVMPLSLLCLWLIERRRMEPEGAVSTMLLLITGIVALLFARSRAPDSIFMPFAIPLPLVFCAVVVRVPFAWTMMMATATLFLAGVAMSLHPGFDSVGRGYVLGSDATMVCFMLAVSFRAEAADRQSFLVTRRETLRAQVLAETAHLLRGISDTDALTAVGNRRFFDATLERLWNAQHPPGWTLGLMMIDIDHFKRLNDRFGHLAGDGCLRAVAETMRRQIRGEGDHLARYGGEEFAVLLSNRTPLEVAEVAERIRRAVEELSIDVAGVASPLSVTVSIGHMAGAPGGGALQTTLIATADAALYMAKQSGRNRIQPPLLRVVDNEPALAAAIGS